MHHIQSVPRRKHNAFLLQKEPVDNVQGNVRCLVKESDQTYIHTYMYVCMYEGLTESHEQLFFLHANWEQQRKESAVVDGTSCCVILECLVTSIACIT